MTVVAAAALAVAVTVAEAMAAEVTEEITSHLQSTLSTCNSNECSLRESEHQVLFDTNYKVLEKAIPRVGGPRLRRFDTSLKLSRQSR